MSSLFVHGLSLYLKDCAQLLVQQDNHVNEELLNIHI